MYSICLVWGNYMSSNVLPWTLHSNAKPQAENIKKERMPDHGQCNGPFHPICQTVRPDSVSKRISRILCLPLRQSVPAQIRGNKDMGVTISHGTVAMSWWRRFTLIYSQRSMHEFVNYIGICSYVHRRGASCMLKIALTANWIITLSWYLTENFLHHLWL